jgi:pimeloyl-ACP methyl ester carboxylesterase
MPQIELPQGTISYRAVGPEGSPQPPVVFIHGLLVNGRLWNDVADRLAAAGRRCYQPDLPLGSHRIPMPETTDLTPKGVAALIDGFLAGLGLEDVTLVGNDTGGALCQFTIDAHPDRVGSLVLTNCDAFDKFPPRPFDGLIRAARHPGITRVLLMPMRSRVLRHSPLGFGLLARSFDPELTWDWLAPAIEDAAIRSDLARFADGVKPSELLEVSERLDRFERPVRVVWGEADRVFKPAFGRRLAETFPDATYVGVLGSRTFVALDAPESLVAEILRVGADDVAHPRVSSPPAAG